MGHSMKGRNTSDGGFTDLRPRVGTWATLTYGGEQVGAWQSHTTQNVVFSARGMALAFLRGASLVLRFWDNHLGPFWKR